MPIDSLVSILWLLLFALSLTLEMLSRKSVRSMDLLLKSLLEFILLVFCRNYWID
ncbi:hypothetical protein BD560DRAFT_399073 [Blakeslea trispora]|nr:hypothetical protein BD560DRAFT_399073 [Blakeslea trispora]